MASYSTGMSDSLAFTFVGKNQGQAPHPKKANNEPRWRDGEKGTEHHGLTVLQVPVSGQILVGSFRRLVSSMARRTNDATGCSHFRIASFHLVLRR